METDTQALKGLSSVSSFYNGTDENFYLKIYVYIKIYV